MDVVGDLDVDCATGPFCSSCAIPPRVVGGLWCGESGGSVAGPVAIAVMNTLVKND